ncbi:hypothetical protein D9C73_016976 [Collichthys lucidus]|uniref:Endonuclease/exonuclease/phosphatase domain-containing protein n=1 Tax=Collichthys lucidus TaxID=240159 RepID=A0A4U5V4T6_COLLU|nr:hypothetical protein D9C73_016976 [Collichthys lucidus]
MSSQCPPTTASALELLQLNVEGLTIAKINILVQLASTNNVTVITLQETHQENKNILRVPGYTLAGQTANKQHDIATFVRKDMGWSAAGQSPEGAEIEWIATKVQNTTIVNIYKPPPSRLIPSSRLDVPAPTGYAGDFNSHHTDWGYSSCNADGDSLVDWASTVDAILLYDPKEPCTFYSAQWNSTTNPDLAFAKCHNNLLCKGGMCRGGTSEKLVSLKPALVLSRSTHIQKLDAALNTALRTVSGCLRATPTNQLPILAGIAPAEVRREAATLALTRKAQLNEFHLLHKAVTETPQCARLKSWRPFAIHAQELLRTTPVDTSKAA